MKYTIIILLNATHHWLALSRQERGAFFGTVFLPLVDKYKDSLMVRLFDAESFHAKHSDYLIIETCDLKQYYYFIEQLRDTAVYSVPYFVVNDIVMGLENAFQQFEHDNP